MNDTEQIGTEPLHLRLRTEASEWDHDDQVAELLLEAAQAVEQLRALVIEAYPGDDLTNAWRAKAEALNAWPKAGQA